MLLFGCALHGQAQAAFTMCNRSLDVINVALGYARDGDFESEGWWVIGANRCIDLIRTAIPARYLYLYAEDVFHKRVLNGTMNACVASGKFLIVGDKACWKRGNIEVPFVEIDTKSLENWTFILTMQ